MEGLERPWVCNKRPGSKGMELGRGAQVGRLQVGRTLSPERLEWRIGRKIKVTSLGPRQLWVLGRV